MSLPGKSNSVKDIERLIDELGSADRGVRKQARERLTQEGEAALPSLLDALQKGNRDARGEAAKILGTLKKPAAASGLIRALEDEDFGVRWSAMDGLIALEQESLPPLIQALMNGFSSVRLREGARRILRVLKEQDDLDEPFQKVLLALEGIQPEVEVPWAAEAAWKSLLHAS